MWTEITRPKYERSDRRYASDPRSEPGAGFERCRMRPDCAYMPPPKTLGRPRTTALRDVINAILYLLRSGCPWRLLPKDFPPRSTVQRYFAHWRDSGLWARINRQLLMTARAAEGRNASPRPASSTLNPSRPPKAAAHGVSMLARRSRGASVISSPIPAACWSPRRSMAPISRTVTARLSCWPLCAARFRDYVMSSPIRPIQAPSWRRRSNRLAAGGWKLSSDRLMRTPLKSCRGAGWLNELWLG